MEAYKETDKKTGDLFYKLYKTNGRVFLDEIRGWIEEGR